MDEPSGSGRIRASDAERERFASFLSAAFTDGRLDLAEYDTRVAAAYAAVYHDELAALIADLPPPDAQLFTVGAGLPVAAPSRGPASTRSGAVSRPDTGGPHGWLTVVVLLGGGLFLAEVRWLRPISVLLLLIGLAIALGWISDSAHRRGLRP